MTATLAAFTVALAALLGNAEPSANEQLIAAMPEGVTGIMLVRFDPLQEEGSKLAETAGWFPPNREAPEGREDDLYYLTRRMAMDADPEVFVWGGSAFERAADIGVGNFDERQIWVVGGDLGPLRARLEQRETITGFVEAFEVGGVTAYHGRTQFPVYGHKEQPIVQDVFVAAPAGSTVVMAETREDIERMVGAVLEPPADAPERWTSLAGDVPLDAPLLVLRRYDPADRESWIVPMHPSVPEEDRVKLDAVVLAWPDPAQGRVRLHGVGEEPQRGADWLRRNLLPDHMWRWELAVGEGEFDATLSISDDAAKAAGLSLMLVFGLYIAI